MEVALDLAENVNPDDEILQAFWPEIVKGKKLPTELQGTAGRRKFLLGLPYEPCISTKGEKASSSKWCSLQQAWCAHEAQNPIEAYVGAHILLRKHKIKSVADLMPAGDADIEIEMPEMLPVPESAPPAASASASAAASSSDIPAPKAKAKGKAKSKNMTPAAAKVMVKHDKGTQSVMHYVTRLRVDPIFVSEMNIFAAATAAECKEHSRYLSEVMNADQTLQFWSNMALGAWHEPLRKTLQVLQDAEILDSCGFTCDPAFAATLTLQSPEVHVEDALAQRLMMLIFGILRHRASRRAG